MTLSIWCSGQVTPYPLVPVLGAPLCTEERKPLVLSIWDGMDRSAALWGMSAAPGPHPLTHTVTRCQGQHRKRDVFLLPDRKQL